MVTNLDYINQICIDLGGVGGHFTNLSGENEICTLLGGTGGHFREIDALNEICTIQSVTAGHSSNLNALNAIAGVAKISNFEAWKYVQEGAQLNLFAQYKTVYDAMNVKPSNQIALLQSALIKTITDAGIFPSKVARLYLVGAHTIGESVIDFVDPTRFATMVNQPAFENNKGLTGVGTGFAGYLDLNFNASTETDKYTQNDAGYGCYINTNVNGIYSDLGAADGTRYSFLNVRNSDVINTDINEAVGGWNTGISNTDSRGFYFVTRLPADGATKKYVYKNKVKTQLSTNSTGVPTVSFMAMGFNSSGTLTQNSQRQYGAYIITKGLTETEENVLSDAFTAYFSAVNSATLPYAKQGTNAFNSLSLVDKDIRIYLDGSSNIPLTRIRSVTNTGTPTFNETALTLVPSGAAIGLNAGDKINFANTGVPMLFSKSGQWTVDFCVKYTALGTIISKLASGVGWSIEIDTDGRLKASAIANLAGYDYCVNKSTDVLSVSQTYHVIVQFNFVTQNAWGADSTPKIIIFIDGKEQIPYPQYDAKAWRLCTATILNTGALVIGSDAFEGIVDEVSICQGLGNAKNLQVRAYQAVHTYAVPTWTKPLAKINLILDQDIDTDCDDAGDIQTAIALKRLGEVNLLGVIVSTASPFAAPAAKAISEWWSDNSLIAQYQGSEGRKAAFNSAYWAAQARETFRPTDTRTNYPDDLITYRNLLASSADNSVVIVTTGYLLSVQSLMNSPADGISSLTGMQLIAAKVNAIFIVDNFYPSAKALASATAYNGSGHPTSWKDVIENCPCDIIFAGAEFAFPIMRQAKINTPDDYLTNPFRFAYHYNGSSRPVWGVLPQLMAARGMTDKFILSHPFTQTINGTTGLADNLVYSETGNRWFMRYADGFYKAYSGNALSAEVDAIFAMDNTTNPAT